MDLMKRSIRRNSATLEVKNIQNILKLLGEEVNYDEIKNSIAGSDTVNKFNKIKASLGLAPTDNIDIDYETTNVFYEALKSKGLLGLDRKFSISGSVQFENGNTVDKIEIVAFDASIKGLLTYKQLKTINSLQENPELEFLVQVVSNRRGEFELSFYDWQYRRADAGKAAVVIFALVDGIIVGSSEVVHVRDHLEINRVEDLTIRLDSDRFPADAFLVYKNTHKKIRSILRDNNLSFKSVNKDETQLRFIADEIEIDEKTLRSLSIAEEFTDTLNLTSLPDTERESISQIAFALACNDVLLDDSLIFVQSREDIATFIKNSASDKLIESVSDEAIDNFIEIILANQTDRVSANELTDRKHLNQDFVEVALPDRELRKAFIKEALKFSDQNFLGFWTDSLKRSEAFKDKPEVIENILHVRRLFSLTAGNKPLVQHLIDDKKITNLKGLFELNREDWEETIIKAEASVNSNLRVNKEKTKAYAETMLRILDSAFPTLRIKKELTENRLPTVDAVVASSLIKFLDKNEDFDLARSKVSDYSEKIKEVSDNAGAEVESELMKLQRVMQVSPNSEAMNVLLAEGLHSSYTITNFPRKNFINTFASKLGGENNARKLHERASHITARSESIALRINEYIAQGTPIYALGKTDFSIVIEELEKRLPNYTDLFGSPDICECRHCRSIYSVAAYFVDLLRFLTRGDKNANGESPFDVLVRRRPDLIHLPLTCENTNTLIPYIDLANEVMEYYVAHESLNAYKGHSTGDSTVEELRAIPQNTNDAAYQKLSESVFPLSLPYHRPLDASRKYLSHLKLELVDLMRLANRNATDWQNRMITAESLGLTPREYELISGIELSGNQDFTLLHTLYGIQLASQLDTLSNVRTFLKQTGVSYVELVEIIKTQFINPNRVKKQVLDNWLAADDLVALNITEAIDNIAIGNISAGSVERINNAITNFTANTRHTLEVVDFDNWLHANVTDYKEIITLYEPTSQCDLDNTFIRTIESIHEAQDDSGVSNESWLKLNRFIRLWRKLQWKIHDLDLILIALNAEQINSQLLRKLDFANQIYVQLKQPLEKIATFWGLIDTYGNKSLYSQLFLRKSIQDDTEVFEANQFGEYLVNTNIVLQTHRDSIKAAYQISDEELDTILNMAQVRDQGNTRTIDQASDNLNLGTLTTIYRFILLAKSLKIKITELSFYVIHFTKTPFSLWDIDSNRFLQANPEDTLEFIEFILTLQDSGFKTDELGYVLSSGLDEGSEYALNHTDVIDSVATIRSELESIENDHPEKYTEPFTVAFIASKLSISFKQEVVQEFMAILDGTVIYQVITDDNLNIDIPDELSEKVTYINASGRLSSIGVISDSERELLLNLPNVNENFASALETLYAKPDTFISENFPDIFNDIPESLVTLINHPAQVSESTLEAKLEYVYNHYLPFLKKTLTYDAIIRNVSELVTLDADITQLLLQDELESLLNQINTGGFSATYFSDASWTTVSLERIDSSIDFSWIDGAPDVLLPNDNFSVRWEGILKVPTNETYTVKVEVADADDVFKLYLDGNLIREKTADQDNLSLETLVELKSSDAHKLVLEYAESIDDSGIRVTWRSATEAHGQIPTSFLFPRGNIDLLSDFFTQIHRASLVISGYQLSLKELRHFVEYAENFDDIEFRQLTIAHIHRLNAYNSLKNVIPEKQVALIDIFELANITEPESEIDDVLEVIAAATSWKQQSLEYLINTEFEFTVNDFKNEKILLFLSQIIGKEKSSGVSVELFIQWGKNTNTFQEFRDTERKIRNATKAKYTESDWHNIATEINNTLRQNMNKALVSRLLRNPEVRAWGALDAEGLYQYLLIDVNMSACMDTSRIVQANSAIQLFITRCLLNLESDIDNGSQHGVSPSAIDIKRWEWMKNYRFYETNRKVFVRPENLLEPEWRQDRSQFFKDMESYLKQNDINSRSVYEAFSGYLKSLNEVSHLEVYGMHQEYDDYDNPTTLHVVARTHQPPYRYFYRTCSKYEKWSAWEKVELDIKGVEEGDKGGVHILPIVWNNRLFLFWPEFIEQNNARPPANGRSFQQMADDDASGFSPSKGWQVKLAWSENIDGIWSSKKLSRKHGLISENNIGEIQLTSFNAIAKERLSIILWLGQINLTFVEFTLDSINSGVDVRQMSIGGQPLPLSIELTSEYASRYLNRFKSNSKLKLLNKVYLKKNLNHKLLNPNNIIVNENKLELPFFYRSLNRTYFVRPKDVPVIFILVNPVTFSPFEPVPDFPPVPISVDENAVTTLSNREREGERSNDINIGSNFTGMEVTKVGNAFGEFGEFVSPDVSPWQFYTKSLEFHTFYHPYSDNYMTRLKKSGIQSLLDSDTKLKSDEGEKFENTYNPNLNYGFVYKGPDFFKRTYYKENVCFDVYGANSLYNWELFFHAPLFIATRLSKNGKYQEAMKWYHFIFDPTTDVNEDSDSDTARFWKVLPFKTTPVDNIVEWFQNLSPNSNPNIENDRISEWRDNPFDPHLIASNRPIAYMKHVVIKYVENLIDWGDSLFREDSRESINEATQLYSFASQILGPRPEFVPKRGAIKEESFHSLKDKWDDFANALVQLENIFPFSSGIHASEESSGNTILGVGSALYFCIPANEKLLESWDRVEDRLFKIRHCQNIDGVERSLALFSPPIDPALIVAAASKGISLGDILSDLGSPPPIYRFDTLIQLTKQFCSEVQSLGEKILVTLEKKDAEKLQQLRAENETKILKHIRGIRLHQLREARINKQSLKKSRLLSVKKWLHYSSLLGNADISVPESPVDIGEIEIDLDSNVIPDFVTDTVETLITPIVTLLNTELEQFLDTGLKLIPKEADDIINRIAAQLNLVESSALEGIASVLSIIPNISANLEPFGMGASISFGGSNLASAATAIARVPQTLASWYQFKAGMSSTVASYIRREQDWTLQSNLAQAEMVQIDKQISMADIRKEIARQEFLNQNKQIENAKKVEEFLSDKFSNDELYTWLKEQLFSVYKQSYNLAYQLAVMCERAYRFELGISESNFIQYGYWNDSMHGLTSGDKLKLALSQLEKSYLTENIRELELTKNISLASINPLALLELRQNGSCFVSLPEEIFDLDYQGHYFRRIKSVAVSIPCVVGPYTSVNCTLSLISNSIRKTTSMNSQGDYEHEHDEGLLIEDNRFISNGVPVTSIATSRAVEDAGLFSFNFRDDRILPFEGGGVISSWQLEMTTERELRNFDYTTISDIILTINYTARASGGLFKQKVQSYLKSYLQNQAELQAQPLMKMISVKNEFPNEWHKLFSTISEEDQVLKLMLGKNSFPYMANEKEIDIHLVEIFIDSNQDIEYELIFSAKDSDGADMESPIIPVPINNKFEGLNKATLDSGALTFELADTDITKDITIKIRQSGAVAFNNLESAPEELNNIYIVFSYNLG